MQTKYRFINILLSLVFLMMAQICIAANPQMAVVINGSPGNMTVLDTLPANLRPALDNKNFTVVIGSTKSVVIPISKIPTRYVVVSVNMNKRGKRLNHRADIIPKPGSFTQTLAIDIPIYHTSLKVWLCKSKSFKAMNEIEYLLSTRKWYRIRDISNPKLYRYVKNGDLLMVNCDTTTSGTYLTAWFQYTS